MFTGDVIDVVLHQEAFVTHVLIETGFDQTEERAGNDRVISGQLLVAATSNDVSDVHNDTKYVDSQSRKKVDLACNNFVAVAKFESNGRLEYANNNESNSAGIKSERLKCLRLQLFKGQSNWVMIRLIQIETK
jgi:hypothetical protein